MQRYLAVLVLAIALGATACSNDDDGPPAGPPAGTEVKVEAVTTTLTAPAHLTAPSGDPRLFVVELGGMIRVIENGIVRPTPFLDISAKVSTGGERGLLSMAFDPQYVQNGRFYVNYTDANGDTRVERYLTSGADPAVADPASASLVLAVPQPGANHNGGHILFGPDGMLYIAMGDGGANAGTAQDLGSLLGKLLRIDVRGATGYVIPADNPFVGNASARAETWAYGLRNPWRISFDEGNRLYIADVGENAEEEVNIENATTGGLNYGWPRMEGSKCFQPAVCDMTGLVLPKHTYAHGSGRCSITGGSVYRGDAMPALRGHYFFADFCADGLESFRLVGGAVRERRTWDIGAIGNIVSFGTGSDRELYVITRSGGVYRLGLAPP
ncbi:MAG: PQQ-dependent sugar dehydrogenase [Gemmatimonadaceae bacterium]